MAATRASDADRDACLDDIEAAFADGRIDEVERESRTQSALQATTVDQLAALVEDLRPQAFVAAQDAKARQQRAASRRSRSPFGSRPRGGDGGAGATRVPQNVLRVAGFEELVRQTKQKFGSTLVDDAAIYPDYASIEVVQSADTRRTERWYFALGYEGDPSKDTRSPGSVEVDLADVDPTQLVRAIRRAPAVLGVEDVTSVYALIRGDSGTPTYAVYVSNEYRESGYYGFALDGTELYRSEFKPL